ncbi:PAS domain-containing sensor histidine kinase [Spirosoma luteum]|uniref:PAS domain-containing sensor histidine kinase n=1 Tax=Spirosoma luteum TaxID=431553 RepID=UPI0003A7715A|nr:PAS domain-containing protein [Spirosoma luteum]
MNTTSGNPQTGAQTALTGPVSKAFVSADELWALIEPLAQAVWETNPKGQVLVDSPTWRAYTGQTRAQWLGEGWASAVHPDERAQALSQWQEALRQRIPLNTELRVSTSDGHWQWTNLRAIPVYGPDGSVGKWIGLNLNIQDRKQAQEARRKSEESLIAAAMGTYVWYIEEDHGEPDAQMLTLFGLPPGGELNLAAALGSLIHPDDAARYAQAVAQAADPASNGQLRQDIRVIHPDGQERWLSIRGQMFFQGAPRRAHRLVGSAIDITERKRREQTQQLMLTGSTVAICLLQSIRDEQGQIVDFLYQGGNRAAETILGQSVENMMGKTLLQLWPGVKDIFFDSYVQAVETGQPFRVENHYDYEGFDHWFEVSGVKNGDGFIMTFQDVTPQKKAQEALHRSETRYRQLSAELEAQVQQRTQQLQASVGELVRSNESLQQFAYIASHDLQEPLRKIQQFGDLLKTQDTDLTEQSRQYLNRMQSAASRMSMLIKDLLDFSRISIQRDASGPVSLQSVVEGVVTTLDLRVQEVGAQIHVGLLPTVSGDASQLGQLFQNLLSNALKFHRTERSGVPVPPHIQIRSARLSADQLPVGVKPVLTGSAYYQIEVADNGIGFDEQYIDRIFQVFQRLHGKHQYAGTGIGLAICEKVVVNHGGAITARSQPGQGATFSIYLPA